MVSQRYPLNATHMQVSKKKRMSKVGCCICTPFHWTLALGAGMRAGRSVTLDLAVRVLRRDMRESEGADGSERRL